ncbi:MAG: rod shape-determining protein RodA [Candidatus Binatia bacterium]
MLFDRRLLTHFEWLLPLLALTVSGMGVATVYSATWEPTVAGLTPFATRQLVSLVIGVVGMLLVTMFDYRRLERGALLVYLVGLVTVLAVPVLGQVGGGARRWIRLGPVSVQSSEIMKVALVVLLARHFARQREARVGLREAIFPLIATAIPAAAILVQPDLGSAALLGAVAMTMLVLGGVRLRWLAAMVLPVLIAAPFLWPHLKPYQQKRILMFVDPDQDPLGAGYHIIQSKIAVGSGEVWGKGFLQGTQNHLNFLPEEHTDFIFSVFAEEWGLVGGVVLMALYLIIIVRGLVVAQGARDKFGILLALGMTATVFWQVVINVGMVTGLFPVVGITLPFFSYGGSSLICLLVGTGLVMNVAMRRFMR